MIMVTGPLGTGQAASVGRRRTSDKFSVPDEAEAQAAALMDAAVPVAPAGILALQEEESDAARDGRARRHGLAILCELAAFQRGLLAGRLGPMACAASPPWRTPCRWRPTPTSPPRWRLSHYAPESSWRAWKAVLRQALED
jgi:Class II flagellar assembly regulator